MRAVLLGLAMHQRHARISQISVLPIFKEQASMSDLLICTIFQVSFFFCTIAGSSQDRVLGSSWGSDSGTMGKAGSAGCKQEEQTCGSSSGRQPSGGGRRRRHKVPSHSLESQVVHLTR